MTITDEEFMRAAQSLIDQPWKWVKNNSRRLLGTDHSGKDVYGYCMTGALACIVRQHRQELEDGQWSRVANVLSKVIREETEVCGIENFNDLYATHDQVMAMMEKTAAKLAEHVDS